jgi:hypothetical protein
MKSCDQDDNPLVLDCVLELRIQDDYCRGLVRVKEDGKVLFDEYLDYDDFTAILDNLFSHDAILEEKWVTKQGDTP